MARDPVCGMEVDEKRAKYKATHKGKTFYFCAPECKTAFEKDPNKYLTEWRMSTGMVHGIHVKTKKKWWKFW